MSLGATMSPATVLAVPNVPNRAPALPPQVACDRPVMPAGGHVFYMDPVRGSDSGDGSRAHPWRNFGALVSKRKLGERLRSSMRLPMLPDGAQPGVFYREQANPDGKVVGGDTILLASGDYGELVLNGIVNKRFMRIAAAPGARPVFTRIVTAFSSHMILQGLVVRGPMGPKSTRVLVGAAPQNEFMPDNLVYDHMDLGASAPIAGHDPQDWYDNAPNGVMMRGDCMTISNSRIHDVRTGVGIIRGRDDQVLNNRISGFSDDGIDFSGDRLRIRGNWITDHWNNNGALHPDCMQGQSSSWHWPYSGLTIDHNVCIDHTSERAVPDKEVMQGISMFDGVWKNIVITCNLVLPRAYHGIALYGMDNARIENNVVVGMDPKEPSWIMAFYSKEQKAPRGDVIRGNWATGFPNADQGKAGTLAGLKTGELHMKDGGSADELSVTMANNTLAVWPGTKVSAHLDPKVKIVRIDGPAKPMSVPEALRRYPLPAACQKT